MLRREVCIAIAIFHTSRRSKNIAELGCNSQHAKINGRGQQQSVALDQQIF